MSESVIARMRSGVKLLKRREYKEMQKLVKEAVREDGQNWVHSRIAEWRATLERTGMGSSIAT